MENLKQKAVALRETGESIKVIARKLGKSAATIHVWVKHIKLPLEMQKELNRRGSQTRNKNQKVKNKSGLSALTTKVGDNYNPKAVGDKSEARILAELLDNNFKVLIPFGDKERYDLVVHENDQFLRIQCKTGRLIGLNSFEFRCYSTNWNTGETKSYKNDVDLIAVYLRETKKVYIFNVKDLPNKSCNVRLSKDDNKNNVKRFAEDHELKSGRMLKDF